LVTFIKEHLDELEKLCLKYQVKRLELFGSATGKESFNAHKSDIDFLVEFFPLKQGEYAECYFGLLESIEELFNRHVDLVMPKAIKNPYFLESINQSREVLYAA